MKINFQLITVFIRLHRSASPITSSLITFMDSPMGHYLHWDVHLQFLLICTLYPSNAEGSSPCKLPNLHTPPTTRSSKWDFTMYRPVLHTPSNISRNAALNAFTFSNSSSRFIDPKLSLGCRCTTRFTRVGYFIDKNGNKWNHCVYKTGSLSLQRSVYTIVADQNF